MASAKDSAADPGDRGQPDTVDLAAHERDVAAAVRDDSAEARDAVSSDPPVLGHGAEDRQFAARDRAAAVADRQEVDLTGAAAVLREEVAADQEAASAAAELLMVAALERAEEELNLAQQALASASALLREEVAAARAAAAVAAGHRVALAHERMEAAVRNAAALARDEAAQARDLVTAEAGVEGSTSRAAQDRVSAAADRVAAALDRQESASDRNDAAAHLAHAYRDGLTGALLREPGRDQLSHAVERARRGDPLVIAFVDVDRLKWFNDTHGHAGGDHLLHQLGHALRHGLRSYDLVVRYGGDEFVCALPGSHLHEAEQRFADIARALAATVTGAAITAGLTQLAEDQTLDEAIAAADRDMYARRGR